ncbi:MAG: glycerol-3-phosphate acyltransferase [Dehalococcoidia bacterium]|nr:glycerol-3-phosphate acyltransferase [Dehalococcoidia bacterium]
MTSSSISLILCCHGQALGIDAVAGVEMTELLYAISLGVSAFWLGSCPFSLWVGRRLLGKDIRDYGDGNPGAVNVFRAGGRKPGCLALVLDMGKGMPFVVLAGLVFGLPEVAVMAVGLAAILGNAFSPILRFRGGKSVAVAGGVLLASLQYELCIAVAVFLFLCFLFVESDGWTVVLALAGSTVWLAVSGASSWELLFMLSVLAILAVKQKNDLRVAPGFGVKRARWLASSRRPRDLRQR